jgi:hypothetical protein
MKTVLLVTLFCAAALAEQFPSLEFENLPGAKVTLPDAAAGHTAVLVIGFSHASQKQTRPWSDKLNHAYPRAGEVMVFSVAALEDVPRLVRRMATHGIRSGVPEVELDRFLLLYQHEKELKEAAQFITPDDAYVMVLGPHGSILWRFHGPLSDAALAELAAHLPTGAK